MRTSTFLLLILHSVWAEPLPKCQDGLDVGVCSLVTNYDKSVPPPNLPIHVKITVEMRQIANIDEDKHTISLIAMIVMSWNDSRLQLHFPNGSILSDMNHLIGTIWTPRVVIQNSIETKPIRSLGVNSGKTLGVYPNSGLSLYEPLLVTFECKMNFASFPFDQQNCGLEFISEDKANVIKLDLITLITRKHDTFHASSPVQINSTGLSFEVQLDTPEPSVIRGPGVTFSLTRLTFNLDRKFDVLTKLYSAYFFPAGCFCGLSLFSYFIKPEVVPGRMGMLVTIFLIVTGIYNTVEAPSGRGYSIIEVFYTVVQITINFALVEYGIILAVLKYKDGHQEVTIFGKNMSINDILKKVDFVAFGISVTFLIVSSTFTVVPYLPHLL